MRRLSWIIQWALNPMTNVLGRGRFETGEEKTRRREGSDVTTEAEIGVMQSQAKEHQQPPGAGRAQEYILIPGFGTWDFWSLEVGKNKHLFFCLFVCFSDEEEDDDVVAPKPPIEPEEEKTLKKDEENDSKGILRN